MNGTREKHLQARRDAALASEDARFWSKVDKSATDGCWVWTGGRNESGYGKFYPTPKVAGGKGWVRAHRWSYEKTVGPIPKGLHILHSCDNPPCVNPDHLAPGTHSQNMAEASERGRCNPWNASPTHCPSGHAYDVENTRVAPSGNRACRTCERARSRGRGSTPCPHCGESRAYSSMARHIRAMHEGEK